MGQVCFWVLGSDHKSVNPDSMTYFVGRVWSLGVKPRPKRICAARDGALADSMASRSRYTFCSSAAGSSSGLWTRGNIHLNANICLSVSVYKVCDTVWRESKTYWKHNVSLSPYKKCIQLWNHSHYKEKPSVTVMEVHAGRHTQPYFFMTK